MCPSLFPYYPSYPLCKKIPSLEPTPKRPGCWHTSSYPHNILTHILWFTLLLLRHKYLYLKKLHQKQHDQRVKEGDYSCETLFVQPGEEEAPERLHCTFHYLKGATRGLEKDLTGVYNDKRRGKGFKLKDGKFRLDVRKKLFTVTAVWGTGRDFLEKLPHF